jgi:hypothetical protein
MNTEKEQRQNTAQKEVQEQPEGEIKTLNHRGHGGTQRKTVNRNWQMAVSNWPNQEEQPLSATDLR